MSLAYFKKTSCKNPPPCGEGYDYYTLKSGESCCKPKGKKRGGYGLKKKTALIKGKKRAIYVDAKTGRHYYRAAGRRHYVHKKGQGKQKVVKKSKSKRASSKTRKSAKKPATSASSGKKEMPAGTYKKRTGRTVKLYKMGRDGKPYYKKKSTVTGKIQKVYVKK